MDTFEDQELTEREKRLAGLPAPKKVDDHWEGNLHRVEAALTRPRKRVRLTAEESSQA